MYFFLLFPQVQKYSSEEKIRVPLVLGNFFFSRKLPTTFHWFTHPHWDSSTVVQQTGGQQQQSCQKREAVFCVCLCVAFFFIIIFIINVFKSLLIIPEFPSFFPFHFYSNSFSSEWLFFHSTFQLAVTTTFFFNLSPHSFFTSPSYSPFSHPLLVSTFLLLSPFRDPIQQDDSAVSGHYSTVVATAAATSHQKKQQQQFFSSFSSACLHKSCCLLCNWCKHCCCCCSRRGAKWGSKASSEFA